MANSLKMRGLPRLLCLNCFHSLIASSSIQKVRESSVDESLIVLLPVVCFVTWFGHETTDLNECSDQVVSFGLSSIDLRKALSIIDFVGEAFTVGKNTILCANEK